MVDRTLSGSSGAKKGHTGREGRGPFFRIGRKDALNSMSQHDMNLEWFAQLQGDKIDLDYSARVFKGPFDPQCDQIEHGGGSIHALRSRRLSALQTADEVRREATALLGQVNGALRVQNRAEPLTLYAVGQVDERGQISRTMFAEAHGRGRASAKATATVIGADGREEITLTKLSTPQQWLEIAAGDDKIADMLVFTGRPNNWFDVYKALELAEDLMTGKSKRTALLSLVGASRKEVERMIRTANMHRHARVDVPPLVPMTLDEASSLLPILIRAVMDGLVASTRRNMD